MFAGPRPQKAEARPVSKPGDRHEREAERAAEVVARGGSVSSWSFSAVPASSPAPVQRQEKGGGEKTEEEKYKEGLKKAGEAALETEAGKKLKEKVLADPVVKAVTSPYVLVPGIAGGVAALAATGKELPVQPPAIPLEKVSPSLAGVEAKITYEGPVNRPTFVGLTITVSEQGPKGKKAKPDPIAADIARLKAQDEMFRKGMRYAPGSKEAEEQRLLDQAVQDYVLRSSTLPGFTIPLTPPPKTEEKKEEAPVQRAPASTSPGPVADAHVDGALSSPGRPLDPSARRAMEARFGYDFSGVRVHDDARAAASAAELDAAAFTVGQDIAFGPGRYAPSTVAGRELLAHELVHTIQQRGAHRSGRPIASESPLESVAERAGRAAAAGARIREPLGVSGLALARQPGGRELDHDLQRAIGLLIRSTLSARPLHPEQADELIRILATYAQARPEDASFTVHGYSNELYELLAPWGFSGRSPASGAGALRASFEDALALWRSDTPKARNERRQRTKSVAGLYVRVPTVREIEREQSQLETEELPGGRVYTGPRWALRRERQRAHAQTVLSKIESVRSEGPFATAGRVIGATAAGLWGRDVQAGGEIGAAMGSLGDVASVARAGAKVRARTRGDAPLPPTSGGGGRLPAGEPSVPAELARTAHPAELARTARPPELARTARPPELARTARPPELARTARPGELARTARPSELARTARPGELARTARPGELAKTAPDPRGPTSKPSTSVDPLAKTAVDPHGPTLEPASRPPAGTPLGPGTQPSVPPAPPVRRARNPALRPHPATPEDAIAAYRANPNSIVVGRNSYWHEQAWRLDNQKDPVPVVFRVPETNVLVVDVARFPQHLLPLIGREARVP